MEKKRIIIVGAGIVGVAVAIHLQRRGFFVSLIDRALPGKDTAASFGNAGVISPSALVPVQYPGMLWQTPSLLRDPDGPLSQATANNHHIRLWRRRHKRRRLWHLAVLKPKRLHLRSHHFMPRAIIEKHLFIIKLSHNRASL